MLGSVRKEVDDLKEIWSQQRLASAQGHSLGTCLIEHRTQHERGTLRP